MSQQTIDGKDPALEMWCRGWGPVPARFMFVGISAGRLGAIKTQVPFTKGPSGRLLQRCLGRLGLSESDEFSVGPHLVDCYLTNFVKGVCLTEKGLNRLPTDSEFEFWWPELAREIHQVKPKVLIALGDDVHEKLSACLARQMPVITLDYERLVKLKHPRAYGSHGALSNRRAFVTMVTDYQEALGL